MSLNGQGFDGLQHHTSDPKQVAGPSPNLVSLANFCLMSKNSWGVNPTSFKAPIIGQGFTGGQQNASPLTSPPLQICDGEFSHAIIFPLICK